jgi:hypothetical protein
MVTPLALSVGLDCWRRRIAQAKGGGRYRPVRSETPQDRVGVVNPGVHSQTPGEVSSNMANPGRPSTEPLPTEPAVPVVIVANRPGPVLDVRGLAHGLVRVPDVLHQVVLSGEGSLWYFLEETGMYVVR